MASGCNESGYQFEWDMDLFPDYAEYMIVTRLWGAYVELTYEEKEAAMNKFNELDDADLFYKVDDHLYKLAYSFKNPGEGVSRFFCRFPEKKR